ncbi:zinc finger domain-containing protein 1 [Elsinoe australis]|uniref:Zinc finger domain-containing protein 1 n=1 Tax=Elsinoe australis TaxID=40998 RepID=A0A4V6DXW0_9PEZI|nr:zinc finger domain-containing protein 1 [Elsinoe australis]
MDNLILKPEHLWNDYLMHTKVKEAFEELKITSVNVPRVFTYISTKNEQWWQSAGSGILTSAQKSDILVSERILPLPKLVRETLVQRYGPERVNGKVLDGEKSGYCLARVYLGDRRRRSRFFSLSNFNLTVDRIEALGLDAERFAYSLGEGLAVINWQAEIDGADVEWVLGSKASSGSSDVPLSMEQLLTLPPCTDTTEQTNGGNLKSLMSDIFLLDFNRCKKITMDYQGVNQIVKAFFNNNTYYPRPLKENVADQRLWTAFSSAYQNVGVEIFRRRFPDEPEFAKHKVLPALVVQGVVEHERKKNEKIKVDAGKDYDSIPDEGGCNE